jgi:hypothetical protein
VSKEEREFARYAAELSDPSLLDEYGRIVPDGRLRLLKLRREYGSWEAGRQDLPHRPGRTPAL